MDIDEVKGLAAHEDKPSVAFLAYGYGARVVF